MLRPGGSTRPDLELSRRRGARTAGFTEAVESLRDDEATYKREAWREPFAGETRFGPIEEAEFAWERSLDAESLAELASSISFVAAAAPADARAGARAGPAIAPDGEVRASVRDARVRRQARVRLRPPSRRSPTRRSGSCRSRRGTRYIWPPSPGPGRAPVHLRADEPPPGSRRAGSSATSRAGATGPAPASQSSRSTASSSAGALRLDRPRRPPRRDRLPRRAAGARTGRRGRGRFGSSPAGGSTGSGWSGSAQDRRHEHRLGADGRTGGLHPRGRAPVAGVQGGHAQ